MLLLKSAIIIYLRLKDMNWKHKAHYVNKSNIDHMRLKQKCKKKTKRTFVSRSKNSNGKKKEKQEVGDDLTYACWSFSLGSAPWQL